MDPFCVKYTEHRTVTHKVVKWDDTANPTRVVRISVIDGDATDSSGDENEYPTTPQQQQHHQPQRIKRLINEIRIQDWATQEFERRRSLNKTHLQFQSTGAAAAAQDSALEWSSPCQEIKESVIKQDFGGGCGGDHHQEGVDFDRPGCFFVDPWCLKEYFLDVENPAPIFFDECSVPDTVLREDLPDYSVHLDGDFGSCIWDVDKYFEA
ncbi:hypothetical protein Tsubulata_043458 [Turnera subulata]|uniref:Uncharacterized protein n=1 Tax=Turnera subulata TaxID=218843 RepID=A0A9Q0JSX4_9ROSI|nr:hypothetical protein Tsubulata_043458 [Turnera subulata]